MSKADQKATAPKQDAPQQEATAQNTAGGDKPLYRKGQWARKPRYFCNHCRFDSGDEREMKGHVREHARALARKTRKEGR